MLFDLIFLAAFLAGWLVCGFVPWLVASIITRGHAGLGMIPACLFAGLVAGLAVPVLGKDDAQGIWLSLLAALGASTLLIIARLLSRAPLSSEPIVRPEEHSP